MDVISYILSKKYIEDSLAGAGALAGKSAYEIAQENGFSGSSVEWLASLKGDTPEIGPNGTWVISGVDTGVLASPSIAGYATEEFVNQQIANIPEVDLTPYATRKELNEAILGIVIPDTSEFVTQKEIDDAIAAIVFPEPDLTPYATKEEVKSAIDAIPEVDLTPYAKKTDLPSLEGLASESYVDEKVGSIVIPDAPDLTPYALKSEIPSTEGLASEEYVAQKIAEAELNDKEVDLSAYATKTELQEAINDIVIPEVDLSDYATKDEIPSVEGLASEEYVDNAVAAVKPDINVYEITSDSVAVDELVALLPEGAEIHSGDVMLVSNSLGVKSAYQFDEEWIACDGNVDASKVIMPFDITLAGSYERVGNLTKTSSGTATFATKGKSVATALQEMLSKREQPKITSNPSVSLSSTSGAKEVGSTVTPTWSATLNPGDYTYNDTGIVASSWEISDTNGNTATTASGSFPAITVTDGMSYKITAKANYAAGAVATDNLGDPSDPVVQIAAGNKSKTGSAITGYRSWFLYVGTDNETAIDSAFVRSTTNKGSSPSTQSSVSIPQGTKRVMVAIPASGKNLTSVIDIDGMGLEVIGNFNQISVDVEGANGYTATAYDVWVAENDNGMAATKYKLVIG